MGMKGWELSDSGAVGALINEPTAVASQGQAVLLKNRNCRLFGLTLVEAPPCARTHTNRTLKNA